MESVQQDPQVGVAGESELPDWLPAGWRMEFRVRNSGATLGQRDKYYYDPVSNRRFRSRKEVLSFIETGTVKKKNAGSDVESSPGSSKRRKDPPKASAKNFNFDDVPGKIKWDLTDIYRGSWVPLADGANRVPETSKQEWEAAFRYVSLHKNRPGMS